MALKMMLWFRSKLLQGTTDSSLAGVDRSVVGGGHHHHHHGVKKQQQPFSFVTQEVRWMIVGLCGNGRGHHHGLKKQQQPFSFVTQEVRWMIVGLYGNGIEAIIMV